MNKEKKKESEEIKEKEEEREEIEEKEEDSLELLLKDKDEKIKTLEKELKEAKENELRRAADTENYRKRLRLDKENAVKYANEALIEDLLTPLDNFSRALEASSKTEDFKAMRDGVAMVEEQMLSMLKNKWGLEVIDAKDKEFDPNTMEAYQAISSPEVEKEIVLDEISKGYKLHGKVIRTSKVIVAKPEKQN